MNEDKSETTGQRTDDPMLDQQRKATADDNPSSPAE